MKDRIIKNILFISILMITIPVFSYGCEGYLNERPFTREDETILKDNNNETSDPNEDNSSANVYGNNEINGTISDTTYSMNGKISIEDIGDFDFSPGDINILREDIFNNGYFSLFDILTYLDQAGKISMKYHFSEDMNTFVIDSINNIKNWWYITYYDGGWPERSVFRMDHYPYKDKMVIEIVKFEKDRLDSIYEVYRQETGRRNQNNGKVIVPDIIIEGTEEELIFNDVEITPHNLRPDYFQDDVITAIDAIMTLGDMDKITYELQWYESIGTASILKDYYVDRINDDKSFERCGFVYEAGDYMFEWVGGNHIHIPPDIRIINSPEYIKFFWICI